MMQSADAGRSRLFAVMEAEVKTDPAEDRGVVQDTILSYLDGKFPGVPRSAFESRTYEHDSGHLSSERLNIEGLHIWSVRFTEPDGSRPGRSWSVETTVGERDGKKWFGGRLSCFSRDLDFDFDPAVPRIYRELVSKGIAYADGIRLSAQVIE
jgi:hypothetical protein